MSGFNDQLFRKNSSSKLMLAHKLRHVSQVDKEIRRNWKILFRILNGKAQIDPDLPKSRLHTVHTDVVKLSTSPQPIKQRKSLGKLIGLHSQINREKVQNKKKVNEQIFFKKKERKNKQAKKKTLSLSKSDVKVSPLKSGETSAKKLMLQPRKEKLIREMGIIEKKYTECLHSIQQKGNMKMTLNVQDQQQLVKRLRGNKVYYKFLSQWNTNKQDMS